MSNSNTNTISAFLYSNRNFELASSLRTFANNYDISLFYITDLKEFFIKDTALDYSVLFIDNFTVKVSRDLIDFITVKYQGSALNIVYLCDGYLDDEGVVDNDKVHKVNINVNFYSQLIELLPKFKENNLHKKIKPIHKEWSTIAYDYLVSLKLAPKHIGFSYLKDAFIYCLAENGKIGNLNKGIYAYLSAKYGTTISNIERNIRLAIDWAWKTNRDISLEFDTKPSNKEFIAVSVNKIYNGID